VTDRVPDPAAASGFEAYRPIARTKTTEQVVERIEQLIIERHLSENEALPSERELAAMLGVSRNILREGLSVLGQKGLVETVPGRRTRVVRAGLRQLRSTVDLMVRVGDVSLADLSEVRSILEPEIAARAAERAGPEQIEELKAIMATLEARQGDPAGHVEADLSFHRAIATIAGNALLVVLMEAVSEPLMRSMSLGTRIPRAVAASDAHHRAVCDAIAERDPEGAAAAMHRHMGHVRRYVIDAEARAAAEQAN
jgi:GntR family transcriptional regulator, transcriptional repressor for pyruvate dehydrogenase complex